MSETPNNVREACERVRRVKAGEKVSAVYGTTPVIVDTVANAWYERDDLGDARHYNDERLILDYFLSLSQVTSVEVEPAGEGERGE